MAVGRINGRPYLRGNFNKKMYCHFSGPEKSDRNNEVTVLTGDRKAGFHCYSRQFFSEAETKELAPSVASSFCCGYCRTVLLLFERTL